MKIIFLLSILPLICFAQKKHPEGDIIKHNRKLFELSLSEGYSIHQNKGAKSMLFENNIVPISKTGADFKTQINASIYPIKCLSVGFIGSAMNLRYSVPPNHKVYDASPLWQYGVFADYNHNFRNNLIVFGGGSYSLTKKEYGSIMIPQPTQSITSQNRYSLGINAGIKYRLKGELYATGAFEYTTMYFTNYISFNGGLSFRF